VAFAGYPSDMAVALAGYPLDMAEALAGYPVDMSGAIARLVLGQGLDRAAEYLRAAGV